MTPRKRRCFAFDKITSALDAAGYGTSHRGSFRCPAHDDRTPSLNVKPGEGRCYIKCFAGCLDVDVLAELGLGVPDLFDEPLLAGMPRSSSPPTAPRRKRAVKPAPEVEDMGEPTSLQMRALARVRRVRLPETFEEFGARRIRTLGEEWLAWPTLGGGWKAWGVEADGAPRLDEKGKLERRNVGAASLVLSPALRRRDGAAVVRLWDLEGESDVLAGVEAGLAHAISGTVGAASVAGHKRHVRDLLAIEPGEVAVIGDRDDAGRHGASLRSEWWRAQGVPVRAVELPEKLGEGGDLRDFLNGRPARADAAAIEPLGTADDLGHLADAAELVKPGAAVDCGPTPAIVRMADVEPEDVEWLWPPYIPLGKLTLLEGDPGLGKTWLALILAAAISRGGPLPGCEKSKPGSVLYLTAEDGLGDTLRPRLDAVEADVSRIFVLDGLREGESQRPVTLADLEVLETAINRVRPSLLVVDPIQAFLGAKPDMNRANEVRPLLAGLGRLAEEYGFAALVIRHLRKSGAERAIQRGLGSIDFSAAARSILLVADDPEDGDRRVVAHVKSSLAKKGPSQAFTLTGGRFGWTGESSLTADDLLAPREGGGARPRDEARELLSELLANDPVSVLELKTEAKGAGVSWSTFERAKKALGIRASKTGFKGGWEWSLPRRPSKPLSREVDGLRAETATAGVRADGPDRSDGLREAAPDDPTGPLPGAWGELT